VSIISVFNIIFELIRAVNTKTQYKNMTSPKSEAWHVPCHQPHGRANSQDTFCCFLLHGQVTY